jgi:ABC-type polysaccharide/polyol phosphate transport system ATPase subunit
MKPRHAAVVIKDLWKSFSYSSAGSETLKSTMLGFLGKDGSAKTKNKELYHGLNLAISPGEVVAFLGKNGSGKSTLLKLISGIYWPDRGEIQVNGKLSALIELGAGFHPEFSGRENVYIYGQILGISRTQISAVLDQIIEFSELGEYIDQPVKVYSSGMYMRLAFSVAVMIDPDILIIDEILSVGDYSFSKKCMNKMNEFKSSGKTICLVSHDLQTVKSWATRAVVLNAGKVVFDGQPQAGVDFYLALDNAGYASKIGSIDNSNLVDMGFSATNLGLWRDRFLGPHMKPLDFAARERSDEVHWVLVASSVQDLLPFGYSYGKLEYLASKFLGVHTPTTPFVVTVLITGSSADLGKACQAVEDVFRRRGLQAVLVVPEDRDSKLTNSLVVAENSIVYSLDWVASSRVHSTLEYFCPKTMSTSLQHVALFGQHDYCELPKDEHGFRMKANSSQVPLSWETVEAGVALEIRALQPNELRGKATSFQLIVFSDCGLSSSNFGFILRAIQDFLGRLDAQQRIGVDVLFWGDFIDAAIISPENRIVHVPWSESVYVDISRVVCISLCSHDFFSHAEKVLKEEGLNVICRGPESFAPSEKECADRLEVFYRSAVISAVSEKNCSLGFAHFGSGFVKEREHSL